jgi:hypothetical protein
MRDFEKEVSVVQIVEVVTERQLLWLGSESVIIETTSFESGQVKQGRGFAVSAQQAALIKALSNLRVGGCECPVWGLVEGKYLVTGPRSIASWIKACGFLAEVVGTETRLPDDMDLEDLFLSLPTLTILFFPNPAFSGGRLAGFNFLRELRANADSIKLYFSKFKCITYADIGATERNGGFTTGVGWVDLGWMDVQVDLNKRRTTHD